MQMMLILKWNICQGNQLMYGTLAQRIQDLSQMVSKEIKSAIYDTFCKLYKYNKTSGLSNEVLVVIELIS